MTGPSRPSRRALWIAAALVALAVAAAAAFWLALPPERLRALVQKQLSARLQREVRFGAVGLGLFPPVRASVSDLAVADPGGFGRGTLFQARRLDLALNPFALLAGRVEVRRLALREPRLHLVLHGDGTSNLDGLAKPPGEAGGERGGMDLEIRVLEIQEGRVLVDDLRTGARRTFTMDQRLALKVLQGGRRVATDGETRLSGYAFGSTSSTQLGQLNAGLAGLALRVVHKGQYDAERRRLALERLDLGIGKTALSAVGTLDTGPGAPRLALAARGSEVDLGEILSALDRAGLPAFQGVRGGGHVTFDLRLEGPVSAAELPAIAGTLALRAGALRYPGAPAGVTDLAATARFARDEMSVSDLRARVAGQPFQGSLRVTRFADPRLDARMRGTLDLAAVGPLIAAGAATLAGRVQLDIAASGPVKEPAALALSGAARLHEVQVTAAALPKRIEHVNGQLTFSRTRATARGLSLAAGGSTLRLEGSVDGPLALLARPSAQGVWPRPAQVQFALSSPSLDMADLTKSGGGGVPPLNARGGGTVRFGRFKSEKLDARNVDARIELEPGVVRVPSFALHAYGGRLNGNAALDLRDTRHPSYQLKARADSLQADAVLSAWTPARGLLTGVLNGDVDLSAQGADPSAMQRTLTALGKAAVFGGRLGVAPPLHELAQVTGIPQLKDLPFRDLKAPFRVERGRIYTDDVQLDGNLGSWRMAGTVGFDGSLDYAISAVLPPEVTSRVPSAAALAAGALGDGHGGLLLDLKLGGSARQPRFSWNSKATAARLTGRLFDALAGPRQQLRDQVSAAQDSARAAAREAVADSARNAARGAQRALQDSLRKVGGDLLRGFFGAPRDTAH